MLWPERPEKGGERDVRDTTQIKKHQTHEQHWTITLDHRGEREGGRYAKTEGGRSKTKKNSNAAGGFMILFPSAIYLLRLKNYLTREVQTLEKNKNEREKKRASRGKNERKPRQVKKKSGAYSGRPNPKKRPAATGQLRASEALINAPGGKSKKKRKGGKNILVVVKMPLSRGRGEGRGGPS